MSTDLTNVKQLANRLRAAIDSIPSEDLPVTMSGFPKGACGDACLLLGAYFADCGIDGFFYIMGSRGTMEKNTWQSHAWLARGTLVVDIAADQFWDAPGPVIVADPSRWHKRFRVDDEPQSPDFRAWHGQGIQELQNLYDRMRSDLFPQGVTK